MSYFDWLVYTVTPDCERRENYIELLFALYSTEFFWVVPRDRNRAEDGLELRDRYERETGQYADIYGDCNCLELMVALAIRCENELMYNPDFGDRTDRWFWMFLDNLGLLEYDNEGFVLEEVEYTLERFMSRNYGNLGQFCAFCDRNCASFVPVLSQKYVTMELAYQMNYYIKDHFYRKNG